MVNFSMSLSDNELWQQYSKLDHIHGKENKRCSSFIFSSNPFLKIVHTLTHREYIQEEMPALSRSLLDTVSRTRIEILYKNKTIKHT